MLLFATEYLFTVLSISPIPLPSTTSSTIVFANSGTRFVRNTLGQILSVGNAGKITDDITVLGQFQHSYAAFTGNTTPYTPSSLNSLSNATQGTAALAYRPLKSDRAGLLFSYTLRQMQIAGVANAQNDKVGLLSTDAYLQAFKNLELYGKVALSDHTAKSTTGQRYPPGHFSTRVERSSVFSRAFDAAAEARMVWQPVTDTHRWSVGNEVGYWIIPDLRVALGYNYKSKSLFAFQIFQPSFHC